MALLIIYIIGYIFAFLLCIANKKEDAKYYYDLYGKHMTNGYWLASALGQCILSWILVLLSLIYFIGKYSCKFINNLKSFQNFKKWCKQSIQC